MLHEAVHPAALALPEEGAAHDVRPAGQRAQGEDVEVVVHAHVHHGGPRHLGGREGGKEGESDVNNPMPMDSIVGKAESSCGTKSKLHMKHWMGGCGI